MKFPLGRWRVLKMDDRNACIKMWMYLMPLNCTLKCVYKGKYSILWKIQFCKEVNSHKLVYRVNAISIKYVYSDTQVRSSQKTEVRWVDETECTLRSTEIRPCTLRKIKLFFNLDLRECVIYSRSFIYLYFFFFNTEWLTGSWFSDQDLNLGSWQWKHQVLTTVLPGNSLFLWLKSFVVSILIFLFS